MNLLAVGLVCSLPSLELILPGRFLHAVGFVRNRLSLQPTMFGMQVPVCGNVSSLELLLLSKINGSQTQHIVAGRASNLAQ